MNAIEDETYVRLVEAWVALPVVSPEEGLLCLAIADRAEELGFPRVAAGWRAWALARDRRTRGKPVRGRARRGPLTPAGLEGQE